MHFRICISHNGQDMKTIKKNTPTIYDVAKLANVSRGTVDRVVYGRGRVSGETAEKVRKAIEELEYSPNPNASSLASKREYRFACLIPSYKPGDYWEEIHQGFITGSEHLNKTGNIVLDIYPYDQTDEDSFRECCREILKGRPNGVIMNAVFKEAVSDFAKELEQRDIPFAFIDNKVDELNYTIYYGVDPYRSGALGAFLLTTRCAAEEIALIRLIRDSGHKADPNAPRRQGFLEYIRSHSPNCLIHTIFIHPDKPEENIRTLREFMEMHPQVKHLAMTNSRVFLLDEFLSHYPDPERIVIGFDDLTRNLECLRKGNVEFLITRHIPQQSHKVLTEFAECVIKGVAPKCRNNYVHMDILHRLNLDDY